MNVAAIDLGSNSFLCLIAKKDKHGKLEELYDTIEFVKLGEGVHKNKIFTKESLQRAEAAFSKFQNLIQKYEVKNIRAVATSAARDVKNRDDFFNLGRKYSIPIEIISGEKEGNYTYLGVLSGRPQKSEFAVLDIGGGSTEIAYKKNNNVNLEARSYNVGCVRLTELFFPKQKIDFAPEKKEEIAELKKYLNRVMPEIEFGNLEMVAVAGTPTTLASLHLGKKFDRKIIENFKLTKRHVADLIQKLHPLNIHERKNLEGIDAPRADVIMAGALILEHVMEICKLDAVTVSTRGVRYGLAYEMLGDEINEK